MVDVSPKTATSRCAVARGAVNLQASTLAAISEGRITKGEVLNVARVAGIMAAKRCDEIIPLCHSVPLDSVEIDFRLCPEDGRVEIESRVRCVGKTGVEMEALLAVSSAALTIYDMVKAVDRQASITDIRLVEKSGGKCGTFIREGESAWAK